jgi:hypothetical protein
MMSDLDKDGLYANYWQRLTKEQSDQNAQRIKDVLQPDDPEAVSKFPGRRLTRTMWLSLEYWPDNI